MFRKILSAMFVAMFVFLSVVLTVEAKPRAADVKKAIEAIAQMVQNQPPPYTEETAQTECRKVALRDDGNGTAVALTTVIVGPRYANCLQFEVPLFAHARTIDIRLPKYILEDGWGIEPVTGFFPRGREGNRTVYRKEHFNGARADSKLFEVKFFSVYAPSKSKEIEVRLVAFDMAAIR